MKKVECFKIRILSTDTVELPLDLRKMEQIHDVTIDRKIKKNPTIIVADPFLFVNDNCLYLFYEKKLLYGNGVIMMEKTYDMKTWSAPKVVLSDKFHLSYPFIFKDEGKVYMIPESGEMSSVRLYEASDSGLESFNFKCDLLSGDFGICGVECSFADSSIFKMNNIYYLNTTLKVNGINNSILLFSYSLIGPYELHPDSPICISNKYGRNAGAWIQINSRLHRFTQDCENRYGDNIHIFNIEHLDSEKYAETIIQENIIPKEQIFYRQGGHQLNMLMFKNKWVLATDAKEYRTLLFPRILHKVGLA